MTTLTWAKPGDDLDDFVLADSAAAAPSTSVPATYPIAIDGHPYKLELDSYGTGIRGVTYRRTTLDAFRQAQDQSATPGEQSRSTEGYWLRSERSFLYGAGQLLFDSIDDGVDNLIRRQRWLDNWNCEPDVVEGLKMLRLDAGTTYTAPGTSTVTYDRGNLAVQAGAYTYVVHFFDGTYNVLRIQPGVGVTVCTGLTDQPRAIASDGYNVWVLTLPTSLTVKWYSTLAGSSVFAALGAGGTGASPGTALFANGFLLATYHGVVFSTDAAGALTIIDTVSTVSGVEVNCFAAAATTTHWYFAFTSTSDFQTTVWKLGLDSSGAFTKLSVALPPLDGNEKVQALHAVGGDTMLIGTTKGFRLAAVDSSGNLTPGPRVDVGAGVTSFAKYNGKVVAAFRTDSNLNAIDSSLQAGSQAGLIMIDVSLAVTTLQPVWWYWWRKLASEPAFAMYVGQNVTAPVIISDFTVYTLATANLITPCSLVTSWVSYGLDADKSFIDVVVVHDALATGDTIAVYYQIEDSTTWNLIGTSQQVGTITNPDPFLVTASSRRLRFAFVMVAGSSSQSTTPRIRRWELRAFPAPKLTDEIMLPVILHDRLLVGDQEVVAAECDTRAEYDFLQALAQSGQIVIFQEGSHTEQVKVSKLELQPVKFSMDTDSGYRFYQGICMVRLLSL